MSTHSTLVEMKAALYSHVFAGFLPQIKSNFLNQANFTATHGHQVVFVVPAYIKRVIDHHCLGT